MIDLLITHNYIADLIAPSIIYFKSLIKCLKLNCGIDFTYFFSNFLLLFKKIF